MEHDDALAEALASFASDEASSYSGSSSDSSAPWDDARHSLAFRADVLYEDDLPAPVVHHQTQQAVMPMASKQQEKSEQDRAALRRARHKAVVARSRMRHKQNKQAMAEQETGLSARLHQLILQHESSEKPNAGNLERLRRAYADQVALQERIRRENAALRTRLEAHDRVQVAIMQVADTYDDMRDEDPSPNQEARTPSELSLTQARGEHASHSSGTWLFFDDDDIAPFYYVPLTQHDCRDLVRLVYDRMLRLYAQFVQRRIPVTELSCFGWTVRRPAHIDSRTLRFQFTKRVRRLGDTMDGIVNRTWEAFHDPKRFAAIYSTTVVTRVVQRVDEDTTVLLQNSPVATGAVNIRYFNILARMSGLNERGERVVALVKTIVNPGDSQDGAPRETERMRDVEWMKRGISYLLLTEETDDAYVGDGARVIQLHYGCDFECVSDAHARYLMVEVLGIACRWEQMILQARHLTL